MYIRLRDSLDGYIICCDCGKVYLFEESDAGHFLPISTHKALQFDERNVHAQYYLHNRNKGHGKAVRDKISIGYSNFMVKKYGVDIIDILETANRKVKQLKSYQIEILIKEYKAKIKEYENQQG